MNFYEIRFDDPLTKYSKYSSNAYTFMYTNINNINLYYQLQQKQKQKQKQQQQTFYHHSDHSMEKNEEEEKNIEQNMDEKTQEQLRKIQKKNFFISDNDNDENDDIYEISF